MKIATDFLLGVSLVALCVAGPAHAQSADESDTTGAQPPVEETASASGAAVTEITVTAQRRAESLQRTPLAITALSSEDLEQANIRSTQDLMQVTPSLQVSTQAGSNSGGSAIFVMRGMGQLRAGNGSEPAVSVYIDNYYYPSLQGSIFSILDIERVEVLRGPQGTLFGRNSIGGAIRYITRRPQFDETSASVQATLGSFGRTDIQGNVNVGLTEWAALRITAGSLHTDGFVRQANGGDKAGGTDTDLVRGQLRLSPDPDLDITLSGQYSRSYLDGFTYILPAPIAFLPFSSAARWNNTPAGRLSPFDNRYASTCAYCQPGTEAREFSETRFRSANASIVWDVSDSITISSFTGYQNIENEALIDQDKSPLPITQSPGALVQEAFSQELQANADLLDDRLKLVGGVYYQIDKSRSRPGRAGPRINLGNPTPFFINQLQTDTWAAFLDGTFKLTDVFSLIGGVRHNVDKRSGEVRTTAGTVLSSDEGEFPATTWRAGVQAQWTRDVMTYATVSRGFRSGGFSQLSAEVALINSFRPEFATNYEIGARMDLFDRRVRINPTVFYTEWTDVQIQRVAANPAGGAPFLFLINAGDARAKGAELEAEVAVTDELRLFGSLALLDMDYTRIAPGVTEITLATPFMRAPKLTYNLGASYGKTFADGLRLNASVNWAWSDEQQSAVAVAESITLPAYGLLSARLELTDPSERFSVALFATNITDEEYYVGGFWLSPVGSRHADVGRPREVGTSFTLRF